MGAIQLVLCIFSYFFTGFGFLVPATTETGCVIIDVTLVDQSLVGNLWPGFRMLLHTYSPLTWIVRGSSTFPDQNTLFIRASLHTFQLSPAFSYM